jgi:BlaI family penicillinase repressor
MARPPAAELTPRELEVMQAFWRLGETGIAEVRDDLARSGRELAYTTVATLVRILAEKGFLRQTGERRPFSFRPLKSYEQVSGALLKDIVARVFGNSREQLLLRLIDQKQLTAKERAFLENILKEENR